VYAHETPVGLAMAAGDYRQTLQPENIKTGIEIGRMGIAVERRRWWWRTGSGSVEVAAKCTE